MSPPTPPTSTTNTTGGKDPYKYNTAQTTQYDTATLQQHNTT